MMLKMLAVLLSVIIFYKSIFVGIYLPATINREPLSEGGEFKKLVYVVLDGLRFDGLVPVNKEGHYYNKTSPMDSGIYKYDFMSIAGIPTATTCRIIGLMTGAPGSKLDLINSFSNTKVSIDHLVNRADGRSCAFYGDQFWTHSFSQLGTKNKTICSFSKDSLVAKEDEIFKELIRNLSNEQDDFIFAHFISLDSFGHTYGTDHPVMASTIQRFDRYLKEICEKLDQDTLLVVVSDHGVTDEGAHGGSSERELASICSFISKKPIKNADLHSGPDADYFRFFERFYSVQGCNTDEDWLKTKSRYNIIHQDDIVTTISYLLGVPTPFNSYGNLIPYLVNDSGAQKRLALLKEAKITTDKNTNPRKDFSASRNGDDLDYYRKYNYFLTNVIYEKLTGRSYVGATASLLIALYLLYDIVIASRGLHSCVHTIFCMAMVSHSYWSFASEDYFWFGTFLAENLTLSNLLALAFYIKSPGRNFLQEDRINLNRNFGIINLAKFNLEKFNGVLETLFFLLAFILAKAIRRAPTKENQRGSLQFNDRFIRNLKGNLPHILFSLYRLMFGADDRESNLAFLSAFMSLDSLIAIHFAPHITILLLCILKNLDMKYTPSTKYSLLSLLPYLCNVEKTVQSINYSTFFTFTDKYDYLSVLISAVTYFALPRLLFTLEFSKNEKNPRNFNQHAFSFIVLLGLYTCLACGWFMYNTLVFEYFFMGRTLFVTGYSLFDYGLQAIILATGRVN